MKVTRIAYSKGLTAAKLARLVEIAARLGHLRTELWDQFGSRAGVGINKFTIGYGWCSPGTEPTTPAALWKDTTADTLDAIGAQREAAKVKVRRAIAGRTSDPIERKRLYTLLMKPLSPDSSCSREQGPYGYQQSANYLF